MTASQFSYCTQVRSAAVACACCVVPQLAAPGWLSWRAHVVLWMELLMGAFHQASAVDLWTDDSGDSDDATNMDSRNCILSHKLTTL